MICVPHFKTALFALTLLICVGFQSSVSASDLTGHWSGDWKSCTSGHKGPLSAEFCKVDACHYEVRFKGRFFKVFPFRYKVTLQVIEETPEKVVLSGSQDLGRIFGTFTYSATVTDNCFVATYTSCKDDGIFRLERCTQPCANCPTDCCEDR
jgi:hypothetical protein